MAAAEAQRGNGSESAYVGRFFCSSLSLCQSLSFGRSVTLSLSPFPLFRSLLSLSLSLYRRLAAALRLLFTFLSSFARAFAVLEHTLAPCVCLCVCVCTPPASPSLGFPPPSLFVAQECFSVPVTWCGVVGSNAPFFLNFPSSPALSVCLCLCLCLLSSLASGLDTIPVLVCVCVSSYFSSLKFRLSASSPSSHPPPPPNL